MTLSILVSLSTKSVNRNPGPLLNIGLSTGMELKKQSTFKPTMVNFQLSNSSIVYGPPTNVTFKLTTLVTVAALAVNISMKNIGVSYIAHQNPLILLLLLLFQLWIPPFFPYILLLPFAPSLSIQLLHGSLFASSNIYGTLFGLSGISRTNCFWLYRRGGLSLPRCGLRLPYPQSI